MTLSQGDNTHSASSSLPQSPIIACLRIPSEFLTNEVGQAYQYSAPVDRVLLGTHSRGTAECLSTIRFELRDSDDDAPFECSIEGTISSTTRGTNGPAIIHAIATTQFTASKSVRFDGRKFVAQPAGVKTSTTIRVTGIDTHAQGLRGTIVRSVANRRAIESRAQAEAITNGWVTDELRRHIDQEFEKRLVSVNRRIETHFSLLKTLSNTDYTLAVRSRQQCIEISLVTSDPGQIHSHALEALPQFPLEPTFELWMPMFAEHWESASDRELVGWKLWTMVHWLNRAPSAPWTWAKLTQVAPPPRFTVVEQSSWLGVLIQATAD